MALLTSMMRTAAITGSTEGIAWWAGSRQGGRWAEQSVRGALASAAPQTQGAPAAAADPAATLRRLTSLHESGALSDEELATLRARLGV
jgi:hypothetical protein